MAIVTQPGKFEGQQDYVEYFYNLSLMGEGESFYWPCECEIGGLTDDIPTTCYCDLELSHTRFNINGEDVDQFPELAGRDSVTIGHCGDGFVYEMAD